MTQAELYTYLCKLADLGYPILPIFGVDPQSLNCKCPHGVNCVAGKGKHPNRLLAPNGSKNASRDKSLIKDWVKRNVGGNWAIATGFPMPDGSGHLFVLDIDPRNSGNESLEALEEKHGKLPYTVRALSGGGGQHFYLLSKFPIASRTVAEGIDLKGTGGYVLIEPSLHTSGGRYLFDSGAHPLDDSDSILS